MNLSEYGWNEFFEAQFASYKEQGFTPARVSLQHRNLYHVLSEDGELIAEVSGKMMHRNVSRADFPTVGDWVAISARPNEGAATIHGLVTRKGAFSRRAVLSGGMPDTDGKIDEQVLAANVDTVFLVSGLDKDFNLRRIERFLSAAWDSGATPVVVLNKADVCDDVEGHIGDVEGVAFGVPIHAVSAVTGEGLDALWRHIVPGSTAAFLGSSGVGKSTLINSLAGEERLDTGGIRLDDSKGRHTTTHREMVMLPGGGILIDTPGMRRLKMWDEGDGLSKTFEDVEEIMTQCRFTDCGHNSEPGCAIKAALDEGTLDPKRWNNYLKLQKELAHLERRKDEGARRQQEREWQKYISQVQKGREELRKKGLGK